MIMLTDKGRRTVIRSWSRADLGMGKGYCHGTELPSNQLQVDRSNRKCGVHNVVTVVCT